MGRSFQQPSAGSGGPCSAVSSLAPGALGRGCLGRPPWLGAGLQGRPPRRRMLLPRDHILVLLIKTLLCPLGLWFSWEARELPGPAFLKEGPLHLCGVGGGSLWKSTAPPAPAGSPRSRCAAGTAFRGPTGACAVTARSTAPALLLGVLRVRGRVPRSRAGGIWLPLSLARLLLCPHCPAVSVHSCDVSAAGPVCFSVLAGTGHHIDPRHRGTGLMATGAPSPRA